MISSEEWPREGTYLDFYDKDTNQWRVGFVVLINKGMCKVRSQGWPGKFDQIISATSNKLKPFRSVVRGYTGQVKNPAIRQHWKFTPQNHQERMGKLNKIISKQAQHTSEEVAQYYRGENYFYLDFLMCLTYGSAEQLALAYDYFRPNILLVKKCLESLVQRDFEGTENEKKQSELQVSYFQIMDSLSIMNGGIYPRHSGFQKNNLQNINFYAQQTISHEKIIGKLIKEVDLPSTYIKMLEKMHLAITKGRSFPVPFIYSVFHLWDPIQKAFTEPQNKQERKKIVIILFEIIKSQISRIGPHDVKDPQTQKELESLLTEMRRCYFKYSLQTLAFHWIESTKITIGSLLIQCDTLERKLRGISKIKDQFQNVVSQEAALRKMTIDQLRECLSELQIVRHLFEENQHPEILKKGSQLCHGFFRVDLIPFSDLLFIWQRCCHKHEAVRKLIYQLWTDCAPFVDMEHQAKFVNVITSTKGLFQEGWEIESLLAFMMEELRVLTATSDQEAADKLGLKLIQMGYKKLIQFKDSPALPNYISQLGKLSTITPLSNSIIVSAFHQIKKQSQLSINLSLLSSIYAEAISKYIIVPNNALQSLLVVLSNPKHAQFAPAIFKLINEVTQFSGLLNNENPINQQAIDQLWKVAHSNPQVKEQFDLWLVERTSDGLHGSGIYFINRNLTPRVRSYVFECLCDHSKTDYFSMNPRELHVFKEFLIEQNEVEKRIDSRLLMDMISLIRVISGEVKGLKQVWDIFLNCKNEQVVKECSRLLLTLHLHYDDRIDPAVKKARATALLSRVEKFLKDGFRKGNLTLVRHALILLKDVIDFVKEKRPTNQISLSKQNFKATIKVVYEGKKYQLEILMGISFYDLKTKIGELLGLDRRQFFMEGKHIGSIALEYAEIPFCFMKQEKEIRVFRLSEDSKNIPRIVLDIVKERIEDTLIDMLGNNETCEPVFEVLEDIDIKNQEGEVLHDKISSLVNEKQLEKKEKKLTKNDLYLELFYLRILQGIIDQPKFLSKLIGSKQFKLICSRLKENPGTEAMMVGYLARIGETIFKILKAVTPLRQTLNQEVHAVLKERESELVESSLTLATEFCACVNTGKVQASTNKQIKVIFNCINIIQYIFGQEKALSFIVRHRLFEELLHRVFLESCLGEIRLIVGEKLKKFIKSSGKLEGDLEKKLVTELVRLYYQIRERQGSFNGDKSLIHFYKLTAAVVGASSKEFFTGKLAPSSSDECFYVDVLENCKKLTDPKDGVASTNYVLAAHLILLATFHQRQPSLLRDESVIHYFMYDCLFHDDYISEAHEVSCRTNESQKAALEALLPLLNDYQYPDKLMSVINGMSRYQKLSYWRCSDSWAEEVEEHVKGQYVGLENPGCICYLNSLMQQLFMTQPFRNAILDLQLGQEPNQLLYSLKQLFLNLMHSEQIALSPLFFTKNIKGADKKSIVKVFMQMDIDEFCSIFFDKVEQSLTTLKAGNLIKKNFGGVYAHQIVSKECVHRSQREEEFLTVGLEVRRTVQESFATMVKGEPLDGENKWLCEKCDKKVKAQKMLTLKSLPSTLILTLKRFEFNYEVDQKIKINEYCQFPHQLDLRQYSQQHINQSQEALPPEHFLYKLKGIVVHTGSADSGHYYSFVNTSEGSWFEFNDSHVSPFDPKDIPDEAFGSKDALQQRVKNAYLLFYQRVDQSVIATTEEEELVEQPTENQAIIHKIKAENKTINKYRLLFSQAYSSFADKLMSQFQKYDLVPQQQQNCHQFALTYFLLVRLRQGQTEELLPVAHKVEKLIESNPEFRRLFLQASTEYNFMEEAFVYCSFRDKARVLSRLIQKALLYYISSLQKQQYDSIKTDIIVTFSENLLRLVTLHDNIHQVYMLLRRVLVAQSYESQTRLIKLLVEEYRLPVITLSNLFAFPVAKYVKEVLISQRDQIKKRVSDLTGLPQNEGKKFVPAQTLEAWHFLQVVCDYLDNNESEAGQKVKTDLRAAVFKVSQSQNLHRIIHESGNSKTAYRLYRVIKSLGLTEHLLSGVEKGLKDYESTKFRCLMLVVYFLLTDKTVTEAIVVQVLSIAMRIQKINEKYFLECNMLHQWMLKFATACPLFLKNLSLQQEFITDILRWITAKPKPSFELIKKHKNPHNDRLLNRMHGLLVTHDPKEYQEKSKQLQSSYEMILDRKFEIGQFEFDSAIDFADEYPVGSPAYYFDVGGVQWNKGKVKESSFGFIKIELDDKEKERECWCDTQRVLPRLGLLWQADEREELEEELTDGEPDDLYT